MKWDCDIHNRALSAAKTLDDRPALLKNISELSAEEVEKSKAEVEEFSRILRDEFRRGDDEEHLGK